MAFGENENILLATKWDDDVIEKWELKEQPELVYAYKSEAYVRSICFLGNGRLLTGDRNFLSLWSLSHNFCEVRVKQPCGPVFYLEDSNEVLYAID